MRCCADFLVLSLLYVTDVAAVFINPYSYGSYDPAAESPATYQYYARYYNPNPHNPYAPYPTHMKPGRFTLPRMYQIDPAHASRYPPNYAETLPVPPNPYQRGKKYRSRRPYFSRGRDSVAVFPHGCNKKVLPSVNGGNNAIFGQHRRRTNVRRTMRGRGRGRVLPKSETELLLERLDGNGGTKRKVTPPNPKTVRKVQPKSETQLLLERLDRGGGVTPSPTKNGRGGEPKTQTQLLLERLDRGGSIGTPKSETQILLDRLDAGSNAFVTGNAYTSGISKNKYGQPKWNDNQPTPKVTTKFATSMGVVRPRGEKCTSTVAQQNNAEFVGIPRDNEANRPRRPILPTSSELASSEQISSEENSNEAASSDSERLPLDRISTRKSTKNASKQESADKGDDADDIFSQISNGRTLRVSKV